MSNAASVHYYLGSDPPLSGAVAGEQLLPLPEADDILFVRGGPGSGKSLFISRIAEMLSEAGVSTEYLYFGRSPDRLGAAVFPELGSAIADGSLSPIEPVCPGAMEREISLDAFYDLAGLKKKRKEILRLTASARSLAGRASRYLSAARSVSDDMRSQVLTEDAARRIAKRARGIAARELKRSPGGMGRLKVRYLDGATPWGHRCRFDTVKTLCDRVYELADSYGLADGMLRILRDEALSAGRDVVACPSLLSPERLNHLIVPSLSLAFVASSAAVPFDGEPYRRIRLDAVPGSEQLRRHRTRLRFCKKITAALLEEGTRCLSQSGAVSEELEALCAPYADREKVLLLAEGEGARLLEKWNGRI